MGRPAGAAVLVGADDRLRRLAGIGGVAVSVQRGATAIDAVPVAVGFVTWLVTLSLLTEPLRPPELAARARAGSGTRTDVLGPARPPATTPGERS